MPQRFTDPDRFENPSVIVCPTLANLRLQDGSARVADYQFALMLGNTSAFDGTTRAYAWNASSAAADDGDATVKPTDVTGNGRWIKLTL